MQTIIQFRLIDKDKNISYISDENIKKTILYRTVAIILRSRSTFVMYTIFMYTIFIFNSNIY